MKSIKEKYKVDIEKLREKEVRVLKAIHREGKKHLNYFYTTMHAFKFPELRMKTKDTCYYEEVLPEVERILIEKGVFKNA